MIVREIFLTFLKLGLTAFGGPVAHLGYFREELIRRRGWLEEAAYADLIALCQFLPGPASSQVGFALGLARGGLPGAVAAWTAFTLPSALILMAVASGAAMIDASILHGLKLVAVAVVAQALWGMANKLCPDRERAAIAVGALLVLAWVPGSSGQILALIAGGLAGYRWCRPVSQSTGAALSIPVSRRLATGCLIAFVALLGGLPILAALIHSPGLSLVDAFYRAGALVFGGGHVVLPMLESSVVAPGWLDQDTFLTGYGAAQAIPGPLFTLSAYLGTAINGVTGAALALIAIFLPGLLILLGTLPLWSWLRDRPHARAIMAGVNAAVVGLLASALYDPVWTSTVSGPLDVAIAAGAFVALTRWQVPPWQVVLGTAVAGSLLVG
ncbi:chromate transporter [Tamilnaduibacter salinus]|uniref:Chromate transporter n=1 Tax=Tamilnaduibacter salinus TaxID=1484056 RepID=A0A2U1CX29_9GAMM|nr:chromate efflux transporter [Tamilnaduibacter salinus]PVY76800.1 chromate transporter [Tamilnaduibacter salinus]